MKNFSVALIASVSAYNQGPISVQIADDVLNLFVVSDESFVNSIDVKNDAVTLRHGARAYLGKKGIDELTPDNYFSATLFDQVLEYDVDISTVGCSCNAALYFVSMPGFNTDHKPAKGSDNDYYCDANNVTGVWCWEQDTFEANKYTMATTPHNCKEAAGDYISHCDGAGCGVNVFNIDNKAMCPDSSCKIDTSKTFRHYQHFESDEKYEKIAAIHNRLVQGDTVFEFDSCADEAYLASMTDTFRKGMVMTFSLWGSTHDTMQWLDGMTGC